MCNKWDNCKTPEFGDKKDIIRDCYDGEFLMVNKKDLMLYITCNGKRCDKTKNIIYLDAKLVCGRVFKVRIIDDIKNMGSRFKCHIKELQAYYTQEKRGYGMVYKGAYYIMKEEVFEKMFKTGVSDDIKKSRIGLTQYY